MQEQEDRQLLGHHNQQHNTIRMNTKHHRQGPHQLQQEMVFADASDLKDDGTFDDRLGAPSGAAGSSSSASSGDGTLKKGADRVRREQITFYIWFITAMISISGLLFGLDTGIICEAMRWRILTCCIIHRLLTMFF